MTEAEMEYISPYAAAYEFYKQISDIQDKALTEYETLQNERVEALKHGCNIPSNSKAMGVAYGIIQLTRGKA